MNDDAWKEFAIELSKTTESSEKEISLNFKEGNDREEILDEQAECVVVEVIHIDDDTTENPETICQIKFWGDQEDCEWVCAKAHELGYIGANNLALADAIPFIEQAEKVISN